MPHSATVGVPPKHLGILLATALLSLPGVSLLPQASAATTLCATTLLLGPERRLPLTLEVSVKLAIVIDDVGYNLHQGERILALPKALTLGMLPYAPYAGVIAERAADAGREVILHQPMEPLVDAKWEPGTLALDMTAERFDAELTAALSRLPHATGVNNHTGSLLTAHRLPMEWLMEGIARRGLYFLDSRTTPDSVAETTARELAVPTLHRDVFLDHVQSEAFLTRAFEQSLAIARRKGYAVVIAHPHQITLDFLEAQLARLPPDVELTTLGALVPASLPRPPDVRPAPGSDPGALALRESPGFLRRSPVR